MASFLRSFATGFISSANERFREDRALQITNDTAKAKLIRDKILPAYTTIKATSAAEGKKLKDAASLRQQLGISGAGEARIQAGLGTAESALEFRQNLTPETRAALSKTIFVPGQTAKPSLEEFAKQRGISVEDLKKAGVDPSQFPGQAAVTPQVTGAQGLDISQALPSLQEQRIQKLATTFISKANMFASNKDFEQAKIAFQRNDFDTVIDLTARSPNLQNNIFLPIIEQILERGIDSLNNNQMVVLDLFKPRDPLDQIMNMLILQNADKFKEIMEKGLAEGLLTEPPGPTASDEENLSWWEQNIGPMFNIAREKFDKIIRGRQAQ